MSFMNLYLIIKLKKLIPDAVLNFAVVAAIYIKDHFAAPQQTKIGVFIILKITGYLKNDL